MTDGDVDDVPMTFDDENPISCDDVRMTFEDENPASLEGRGGGGGGGISSYSSVQSSALSMS